VAGQQYEYAFDDIGNRTRAGTGGDQAGADLRYQDYTRNRLNQYASRTVPGYAQVLGSANSNATVSLWADTGAWAQTSRKGDYFRGELSFANNNGPVYASVNSVASLTNGSSPDIVTNVAGSLFVPATPEAFDYDDDGNLTSDGRWNYTWDAENRLVKMAPSTAVGPQNSIEFAYDWQSRRVRKQVWSGPNFDGTLTSDVRFVYDGWNLIATLDSQSSILQSFVWGLDLSGTLQGAGGVGGLLFINDLSSAIGDCAAAYDGNGNVTAVVSMSAGTNCATYEYGPFGELLRATGPMAKANPFRFSTKHQDDDTELLYFGFRYLNPSTAKWLGRDPIGEWGGQNLYGFVMNNPVLYEDWLGLQLFPPILSPPPVTPPIVEPVPPPITLPVPVPQPPITIPIPFPPQVPPMPMPPILLPPTTPSPTPSPSPAPSPQPGHPLPPDQGGPAWPHGPDGDCTPERKRFLQHRKDAICNLPRSCRKCKDDIQEVWRRIRINEACFQARKNIMDECYRGGDAAHKRALDDVEKVLKECYEASRALGAI